MAEPSALTVCVPECAYPARTTTPPRRWVAHLDMDAFYASVELLRRPSLRGHAVVVGGSRQRNADFGVQWPRLGDYTGRGVVTTATYEARARGIHSGMGLMKAAALAPHAVLLPADFEEYRRMSRLFKAAVAELAPAIEDRGIDEIYIELTALPRSQEAVGHDPWGGVRALAQDIKNNVRQATGLSCSIGIAPNKLLAKICSDLDKPDGLTLITEEDVSGRIWPLPVRRINGIGPKAGAKLEALGVVSIGDLAACEVAWLAEHFGPRYGRWMHDAARGHDPRPVVTESEPVSMSRETTFERDLHPRADRETLGTLFTTLCRQVAEDLQRKGYVGRTIGIKLRFDDFSTVTRDLTQPTPTADPATIRQAAGRCLKRVTLDRRLRLLGVRVGNLSKVSQAASPAKTANRTQASPTRITPSPPTPDAQTLSLFPELDLP